MLSYFFFQTALYYALRALKLILIKLLNVKVGHEYITKHDVSKHDVDATTCRLQ